MHGDVGGLCASGEGDDGSLRKVTGHRHHDAGTLEVGVLGQFHVQDRCLRSVVLRCVVPSHQGIGTDQPGEGHGDGRIPAIRSGHGHTGTGVLCGYADTALERNHDLHSVSYLDVGPVIVHCDGFPIDGDAVQCVSVRRRSFDSDRTVLIVFVASNRRFHRTFTFLFYGDGDLRVLEIHHYDHYTYDEHCCDRQGYDHIPFQFRSINSFRVRKALFRTLSNID